MEIEQAQTFDACDVIVHERPASYECHRLLAQRTQSWREGIRHLEARLALDPEDHVSRLALGALRGAVSDPQGDDDLGRAAEGLEANERYETAGLARLALFYTLGEQRRLSEAASALQDAERAQKACGSPVLARLLEYYRGLAAMYQHDYAGATVHLREAGSQADAAGDRRLQAMVLAGLGACAFRMGAPAGTIEDSRRAADIYHASGDEFNEAGQLYNLYLASGQDKVLWPESEREPLYERTMVAAKRSGNIGTQSKLLFARAQAEGTNEERLILLKQSLDLARRTREPVEIGYVMRYTAHILSIAGRRHEADAMLDDAIRLARGTGDAEAEARAMIHRATIFTDAGDRARALATWDSTLRAIEDLRDFQSDDEARAGFQSGWAFLYYRVAAYTLGTPGAGAAPEDIEKALAVIERMRARILLDSLDAAGAATGRGPEDLQERRAGTLDGISRVQRRLLSPILSDVERTAALGDLETLENRERALRTEMAHADASFASLRVPALATVPQIRQGLDEHQAIISFQSDSKPANAGWAVAITRDAARTVAIPSRRELDQEVSLFLGMLERRDGSEAPGAARLYKDLLADLLRTLPAGVTRLVVIPDGPLHRLPFDALRPDAAGAPLAARFEITIAPSCAAWLRWNATRRGQAEHPVLALADPWLRAEAGTSTNRAATLATGLRIGSLPSARAEAGEMVRRLGGGSRMVAGADATERFLKTTDLSAYRMLHLAAHAVVDEDHPERSAVLLAPGSDGEDGLLQSREIVNLDMKGRVVILSACSSASGSVLEGEGVMGLARAFFQAGAVGVVGGLWPLRDAEAARLVDDMAAALGRGASLGAALAEARRAAIGAGAPASAWAGLVVLGDGDFVPLPGGRAPGRDATLPLAIAAALLLAAGALLIVRRFLRRSRGSPPPN
jgi:CHAT domain-containing protein/tetratricopeptide (TPR) repeat protein